MKKIALTALGLTLTSLAVVLIGAEKPAAFGSEPTQDKRVRVAAVETMDLSREVRFSGTLRAADRAALSFPLPGRMIQRPVDLGDRVTKGQLLAELDLAPLRNAVSASEAALAEIQARRAQNKRDVARIEGLVNAKAATTEELEQVRSGGESLTAAEDAAKVQLDEAKRLLKDASLRAPFDGVVTAVHMEAGEFAGAGAPILALNGQGDLELEVDVPEFVLGYLEPGKEAGLELPLVGGRQLSGTVRTIGAAAAGQGRLFPIVIDVDAQGLIPGQTADLLLTLLDQGQLTVPVDAVINPGGGNPRVYRVRQSTVNRVQVRIGRMSGARVAVIGDLRAGDQVVVGGFYGLRDGEKVEVMQ